MDLVNMLGNSIHGLNIYNNFHRDIPFIGISNSSINKNSIIFMGTKVEGFIINFINKLLDLMDLNKSNLVFEPNQMDLKKMLSEIGKLLSILFVNFPTNHPFLDIISTKINKIVCQVTNKEFGSERILKIIEYGFNCSKSDVPVIMTNFEEHLKESITKQNEFSDANLLLNRFGTGLNAYRKISIPYKNNALCIISNGSIELDGNLGSYPNSMDKFGNVYFGLDSSEQAIRIGMRKLCEVAGFPNARNSSSVIFYVLNLMSMMYLQGIELDCEHMKLLRKIAIAQVSMEVMVSQNKYDGKGCYYHWKNGKQIPMHFSKTSTHTSLYSDKLINPLGLPEPIWWALQMSMLGLFEEQKPYYAKVLEQMDIEPNPNAFLVWYKNNYADSIEGSIQLLKTSPAEKSIFTLDEFEPDDEVFSIKEHGQCNTNTWYSKVEIETYIMEGGCVWCKYKPLSTDLCPVIRDNLFEKITTANKIAKPIRIKTNTIFNTFANMNLNNQTKRFRINLIGITGSGKSTCSEKIKNFINQKGGEVLIVSADKWSKQGFKGKDLQNKIFNEIRQFDTIEIGSKTKVIVMDLCNENGVSNESFGFNFSAYTDINFYPNLDENKFDQYEAWCLHNVLSRPNFKSNSNYWLNPVSAGISTCIKVHNSKARGVANLLNKRCHNYNENMNMAQITNTIFAKADQYRDYLQTRNLQNEVEEMIMNNILI